MSIEGWGSGVGGREITNREKEVLFEFGVGRNEEEGGGGKVRDDRDG